MTPVLSVEELDRQTADSPDPLRGAILVALGAASVSWEPMDGTGVFQDRRVAQIADDLVEYLHRRYALEPTPVL